MRLESLIWSEVMSDRPTSSDASAEELIEEADELDYVLTERTVSITEFKKHPNKFLRQAKGEPFAVMTNNRPSFYVLSPEHYDELLEQLWEAEVAPVVMERIFDEETAVELRLDRLK